MSDSVTFFKLRVAIFMAMIITASAVVKAQAPAGPGILVPQYGLGGFVAGLQSSTDGNVLATSGPGGAILIWDLNGLHERTLITRPINFAWDFALSDDGKTVATPDGDGIHLWNSFTGALISTLPGTGLDSEIAFSPDGTLLAQVTGDGTLVLWDIATKKPGITIIAGKPSGGPVFSPGGTLIALGLANHQVGVWRVKDGSPVATFGAPRSRALSVTFSPSGRIIAASAPIGGVVVADSTTGKTIATLPENDVLNSVAFSPDSSILAIDNLQADGAWHIQTLDTGSGTTLFSSQDKVPAIAMGFTPDNKTLTVVTRDDRIRQLDARTGNLVTDGAAGTPISSAVILPNGSAAVVADTSGQLTLRNVGAPAPQTVYPAYAPSNPLLSPDGRIVVSPTINPWSVELWDLDAARLTGVLPNVIPPMLFSPDGKVLAAQINGGNVVLDDPRTLQQVKELSVAPAATTPPIVVVMLQFSPDSKLLAVTLSNKSVQVWDVQAGTIKQTLSPTLAPQTLAFSPDGQSLAMACAVPMEQKSNAVPDLQVTVWNLETGKSGDPLTGLSGWAPSLVFSPHGDLLAGEAHQPQVIVWTLATGATQKLDAPGAGGILFSPDSSTLLVDIGNQTQVWSTDKFVLKSTLAGGGPVFTTSGKWVMTLKDGTPEFWDVPELKEAADPVAAAADVPDGDRIRAFNVAGGIALFQPPASQPFARLMGPPGANGQPWLIITSDGNYISSDNAGPYFQWNQGGTLEPLDAAKDTFQSADKVKQALAVK